MERKFHKRFTYEVLEKFTDGFSKENFIGKFQFGNVYRGQIQQEQGGSTQYVTVKVWEPVDESRLDFSANHNRLMDELFLLQHPRMVSHPNMVNLIGYCCENEKRIGVVYDLNPLDTVENLIPKDSFSWSDRIAVAYDIARLLEYLQTESQRSCPILVRNIQPDHLMVDQNYTTKLFDFGMICGGILPDWSLVKYPSVCGNFAFHDLKTALYEVWLVESDIYSFGVLLLSLISKKVYINQEEIDWDSLINRWATNEYKRKFAELGYDQSEVSLVDRSLEDDPEFSRSDGPEMTRLLGYDQSEVSLVDRSLEDDPEFSRRDGPEITRLAMQCVQDEVDDRPLMEEVVERLRNLDVVQHLGF